METAGMSCGPQTRLPIVAQSQHGSSSWQSPEAGDPIAGVSAPGRYSTHTNAPTAQMVRARRTSARVIGRPPGRGRPIRHPRPAPNHKRGSTRVGRRFVWHRCDALAGTPTGSHQGSWNQAFLSGPHVRTRATLRHAAHYVNGFSWHPHNHHPTKDLILTHSHREPPPGTTQNHRKAMHTRNR
jgi:hypothetical protein